MVNRLVFSTITIAMMALCMVSGFAHAQSAMPSNLILGKVTRVLDGDSIEIRDDKKKIIRVDLAYIDTPDMGKNGAAQPYYKESTATLAKLIHGKEVIIEEAPGVNRKSGKKEGIIFLDKLNVNLEMVRLGMAEIYNPVRTSPDKYGSEYTPQFLEAEKEAKNLKAGIWSLPDYVSPYTLRHKKGGDGF